MTKQWRQPKPKTTKPRAPTLAECRRLARKMWGAGAYLSLEKSFDGYDALVHNGIGDGTFIQTVQRTKPLALRALHAALTALAGEK